jgi:divalent metal cation (Fe/Co/Zn/Cd) transporter
MLEWFSVAWNVIEGLVAVGAGIFTGSVSLVAFGADSFIEVISAVALPLEPTITGGLGWKDIQ